MKNNKSILLSDFLVKYKNISNDDIAKYFDQNLHWVLTNLKDISLDSKDQKELKKIDRFNLKNKSIDFILGYKYFYGIKLFIQKGVFVPQYDTEVMVEKASELIVNSNKDKLRILEPFIGSGAISISLLKDSNKIIVEGFDISKKAVLLSLKNAYNQSFTNHEFNYYQLSIDDFITDQKYDIIIANPPYIKKNDKNVSRWVRSNQPKKALYANNHGLEQIQNVLNLATKYLNEDGYCLIEFGFEQKKEIHDLINSQFSHFKRVEFYKDYGNNDRFVLISFK